MSIMDWIKAAKTGAAVVKKIAGGSDDALAAARAILGGADEAADAATGIPKILQRVNAQNITPATGRVLDTGLQMAPAVTATAKSPGSISRIMQTYNKMPKWARGGTKLGLTGLGLTAAYKLLTGGDSADVAAPIPQSVLSGLTAEQKSQADVLRDLLAGPQFSQTYQQQAEALNNQQLAELDKYLGTYGKYSTNQAQTIMDEFKKIAAASQALAGTTAQEGQATAADIDRLYQDYADTAAALYAGEGLAAPAGETSGMVPVSGEMATQAQTVPTYGQSLADYLGREAQIAGTGYEALGQSQLAQGAGMSQALRDRYALLDAQMRYQAGLEAANRLAGAQAQDVAFQRDIATRIAEAEAADAAAASERARSGALAWVQAGQLWEDGDENKKRNIEAALGIDRNMSAYKDKATRKQAIQDMVLQYPELLNIISLVSGE